MQGDLGIRHMEILGFPIRTVKIVDEKLGQAERSASVSSHRKPESQMMHDRMFRSPPPWNELEDTFGWSRVIRWSYTKVPLCTKWYSFSTVTEFVRWHNLVLNKSRRLNLPARDGEDIPN